MSCPGGSVANCNHCEHRDYCDRVVHCPGCCFPSCRDCEDSDCPNNVSDCVSFSSDCESCQFVDECEIARSYIDDAFSNSDVVMSDDSCDGCCAYDNGGSFWR